MPKITDRSDIFPDGHMAITIARDEVPCLLCADVQVNRAIHKGVEISLDLLLYDGSQMPGPQARAVAQEHLSWGQSRTVCFTVETAGTYYIAWKGQRFVRDARAWMIMSEAERLQGFANTFNASDWVWTAQPGAPKQGSTIITPSGPIVDLTLSAAEHAPDAQTVPAASDTIGLPGVAAAESGVPSALTDSASPAESAGAGAVNNAGPAAPPSAGVETPPRYTRAPLGDLYHSGSSDEPHHAGCLRTAGCGLVILVLLAAAAIIILAIYGPTIARWLGL